MRVRLGTLRLGVGLNAARAGADDQGRLTRSVLEVRTMRGGVSGGTVDSLRQQIIETRSDPALRALAANPRALTDPPGQPGRWRGRPGSGVSRDRRTGRWQAPFVLGGFNAQTVLRSQAMLGADPDHQLGHTEVVDTGLGAAGAVRAGLVTAGFAALLGGMWFPPTRRLLHRVLPGPGAGPSPATRRRGRFLVEVVSETTTGARYQTRVAADADPGYDATAIMFGQAGLSLAEDRDLPERSGVLTPLTALGTAFAERLRRQGFTVETERLS